MRRGLAQHLGINRAGADGADENIVRLTLDGQNLRQAGNPRLRDVVRA